MSENIYLIIGSWIIVTLAAERTTEIISHSTLFFPLRMWLSRLALSEDVPHTKSRVLFIFFHNIVSCAWCLSVWVSMFFCWFLPGRYFYAIAAHNILVKWLALVGAINLWHAVFRLVFRGRVITIDVKHTIGAIENSFEGEMSELNIAMGDGNGKYQESDEPTEDSPATS